MRKLLLALYVLFPFILFSQNFDVVPIHESGPADERIDIVILADGYTADELDKMETDANRIKDRLLSTPVFNDYQNFLNIVLIKVISQESGASHPGTARDEASAGNHPVKAVNNYFGSSFDRGGTHRAVLPTNYSAIYNVLNINYPGYDNILVMVNSTYYGGAASGSIAAFTMHPSAPLIAIHELGHSLGGLGDEYDYGGTSSSGRERPNTTSETRREFIKWNSWIKDSTPIPTPEISAYSDVIGLFEGASYRPSGWFRPALNCTMKSLSYPFCDVCEESFVINFYKYVSPFISRVPDADELQINSRGTLSFGAELIEKSEPTYRYNWLIEGIPIRKFTDELTIEVDTSSNEFFTVTLEVMDTTSFVRKIQIKESNTWTVQGKLLTPIFKPDIAAINMVSGTAGDTLIIQGNLFSPTPELNKVSISGYEIEVLSSSLTRISAKIPSLYLEGKVVVAVAGNSDSTDVVFTTYPTILEMEPSSGYPGDTIRLFGTNFNLQNERNIITDDPCRYPVINSNSVELNFVVPDCVTSSYLTLQTGNSIQTDSIYFRLVTDTIPGPKMVRDWQFGTNKSDSLLTIIPLQSGGYLAGSSITNEGHNGSPDYWVAKLNADKEIIWEYLYGGDKTDILTDLEEIPGDGYVVTGYSNSGISGDKSQSSRGYSDFWVLRLDIDGRIRWERTFGGQGEDMENYVSCRNDGVITLAGSTYSGVYGDKTAKSNGSWDYWVLQLSKDGSLIADYAYGGDNDERVSGMCKGPSGDLIVSGISTSDRGLGRAGYALGDVWVISLTSEGVINWERTMGGDQMEIGGYVKPHPDGGFLVAASSKSPSNEWKSSSLIGGFDYWVIHLDNGGEIIKEATFGTTGDDIVQDLATWVDDNGMKVYLGGFSGSDHGNDKSENNAGKNDFWIISLSEQLDKTWDRTIGGNDQDYLSALVSVGPDHLLAGGTSRSGIGSAKSLPSIGENDIWLVEMTDENISVLQPDAAFIDVEDEWIFGGTSLDYFSTTLLHPDGSVYFAGYSKSFISGNKEINPKGLQDYWLIKTDAGGQKLWQKVYGGNHNDNLSTAILTSDGNILLGGSSRSDKSGDKSENSRGFFDYWLIKIDPDGNVLWEKTFGGNRFDILTSVIELQDGNYLIGGSSESDASGDKSENSRSWNGQGYTSDYWVIKINTNGELIWERTLGGFAMEKLKQLVQDENGFIYVGGTSNSYPGGEKTESFHCLAHETWTLRLNNDGEIIWDKAIEYAHRTWDSCYGYGDDLIKMIPDDRGFIQCFSQIDAKDENEDNYIPVPLLMSYDLYPDGTIKNERYVEGFDYMEDIIRLPDGGYYAALNPTINYSLSEDFGLVRLDRNFKLLWKSGIKGTVPDANLHLTTDNESIYFGGTSTAQINSTGIKQDLFFGESDLWVLKFKEQVQKNSYDSITATTKTTDGGYILAGVSSSPRNAIKTEGNKGGLDYWILKYDKDNNLQWERTLGGSQDDILVSIGELQDGTVVAGGYSFSNKSADKTENHIGMSDIWVVALDDTGKKLWDRTFGGTGTETGGYIDENSDGGLIIGATSDSPRSSTKSQQSDEDDYWLIRTDVYGNMLWDRTWKETGNQELTDIKLISSGDIVFIGLNQDSLDFFRYNQYGWRRNSATLDLNDANGRFIIVERDNDLILAGTHRNSYGDLDYTAISVNGWGNKNWHRNYGGLGDEVLADAGLSDDGRFFLSGFSKSGISKDRDTANMANGDLWIIDVSPYGYKTWEGKTDFEQTLSGGFVVKFPDNWLIIGSGLLDDWKTFETRYIEASEYPEVDPNDWILPLARFPISYYGIDKKVIVLKSPDGGNLVAGYTEDGEGRNKTDVFPGILLIKTSNEGEVLWDRTFELDDQIRNIVGTPHKDGYYFGVTTESGQIGVKTSANRGLNDIWLLGIDNDGNLEFERSYGDERDNTVRSIKDSPYGLVMMEVTDIGDHYSSDNLLYHLDFEGNEIWSKELASMPYSEWHFETYWDSFYAQGGLGESEVENYLIKYDYQGNVKWQRPILRLADGIGKSLDGIFVYSIVYSLDPDEYIDAFIQKYNGNGSVIFENRVEEYQPAVGSSDFTKFDLGFVLFAPGGDIAEFNPDGTLIKIYNFRFTEEEFGYDYPGYLEDAAEKDITSYVRLIANTQSSIVLLSAKPYAGTSIEITNQLSGNNELNQFIGAAFPNPTVDNLWIVTGDDSIEQINVYDLTGRSYQTYFNNEGDRIRLNLSGLSNGIYIIKAINSEGESSSYRILKN